MESREQRLAFGRGSIAVTGAFHAGTAGGFTWARVAGMRRPIRLDTARAEPDGVLSAAGGRFRGRMADQR